MSRIVIALGGNALGNNPKQQQKLVKEAVKNFIPLIKNKHELIITHGNGPQVGVINLAFEDSYQNKDIPYMPMAECTSMSQGYIGYHLQKGLRDVLTENNINKNIVTIITQVVVDKYDEAFKSPTKPVGPYYTKEFATSLSLKTGEVYKEDSGKGYRKVVASPKPLEIVEIETIKDLVNKGSIVITCGGGGIPIFKQDEDKGANAVVDKDLASSLLPKELKADMFIILTNINQVKINYNKENEKSLDELSVIDALKYMEEGQFAKGSMLPKIESCLEFVKGTNKVAVITSLTNLENAIKGKNKTTIYDSTYIETI